MRRTLLVCATLSLALVAAPAAHAAATNMTTYSNYLVDRMISPSETVMSMPAVQGTDGKFRYLQGDNTGQLLCSNCAGGGGSSNAAAGPTGQTVPGSASYTGYNDGSNNTIGVSPTNNLPVKDYLLDALISGGKLGVNAGIPALNGDGGVPSHVTNTVTTAPPSPGAGTDSSSTAINSVSGLTTLATFTVANPGQYYCANSSTSVAYVSLGSSPATIVALGPAATAGGQGGDTAPGLAWFTGFVTVSGASGAIVACRHN